MRFLFLILLGFFGPALLMFFLRLLWSYMRARWQQGLSKASEPEIIDVTPVQHKRVNKPMLLLWLLLGLACTTLLIWYVDDAPAPEQTYIPAHIDAEGNFVPAQIIRKSDQ